MNGVGRISPKRRPGAHTHQNVPHGGREILINALHTHTYIHTRASKPPKSSARALNYTRRLTLKWRRDTCTSARITIASCSLSYTRLYGVRISRPLHQTQLVVPIYIYSFARFNESKNTTTIYFTTKTFENCDVQF